MKAVVAAFNQEKALVGAFSVITNIQMELFEALVDTLHLIRYTSHYIAAAAADFPDPFLQSIITSHISAVRRREGEGEGATTATSHS